MILVLTACTLAGRSFAAGALDTIIIDAGYDKQTTIAVVPFSQGPEFDDQQDFAQIVEFDLARSGQFAPTKKENMLSYPTRRSDVFFRDWRVLGVEYLVIGRTSVDAAGNLQVEYRLFDVFNEREMISETIGTARSRWRDAAHHVSDKVFEAITGIRGAFSTRILYVLAQNVATPDERFSLQVADSDGQRAKTLFTSTEPLLSASWAPDAKSVVYVSFETGRPSIVLQDLATGKRELVTNFTGINGSPKLSPDGRQLAMVLSKDGNPEIYVMNLANRSLKRVTRQPAIDTEPSWTGDGRYLIFTSDRGGRPQIYRVELATNLVERLTFQGPYNTSGRLLPDGEHLVFVHRRNGVDHIAWQDLGQDDLRVLTQTSLDESPSIAPNGTMLIYATQVEGRGILAVVSIDGRVKYRLPSSAGDVREPAWSPFIETL
ncbi:MAG: Tol-Pal system beta propeller repeat protein TolB [Pseudomonadales bacterium]|jgi:TolB protein